MKHFKYLRYLLLHKWFVYQAGLKTGAPLWRLVIHDWTKFLPSEWMPYANYFYGNGERRKNPNYGSGEDPLFDRAWLLHIHRSPHHWQHWILHQDSGPVKILPIPVHFVREMVADWAGAGRAITGKWEALSWYEKNKAQMIMTDETHRKVSHLLEIRWEEIERR